VNETQKLNAKWIYFKTKIEAELNKNSIGFGDIQPGHIYHLPIVTGYRTDFKAPALAGFTKDFFIKLETANTPDVKFPIVIGYSMGARLVANDEAYMEHQMRCIIEEIKLSIKHASGLTPEEPHYGYYVNLSEFEDMENYAAYQFMVTSKIVPMIQLGRTSDNVEIK
jgi:hypothetical protein